MGYLVDADGNRFELPQSPEELLEEMKTSRMDLIDPQSAMKDLAKAEGSYDKARTYAEASQDERKLIDEWNKKRWVPRVLKQAEHEVMGFVRGVPEILGTPGRMMGSPSMIAAQQQRDMEKAIADAEMSITGDKDWDTMLIGRGLPYLTPLPAEKAITGAIAKGVETFGPPLVKTGKKVSEIFSEKFDALNKTTGDSFTKASDYISNSPLADRVRKAYDEQILPGKLAEAKRIENTPVAEQNPFYPNFWKDTGTATVRGGLEGAAHDDQTLLGGASTSGLGYAGGKRLLRGFEAHPNLHPTQDMRDTINWAVQAGYRVPPGLLTGSGSQQMFEAGLRNPTAQNNLADYFKLWEQPNDMVTTRIVLDAAGFDSKNAKNITKEMFANNKASLKKEYEDLVGATDFKMSPADMSQIIDIQKRMDNIPNSPEGRLAKQTVKAYIDHMARTVKAKGKPGAVGNYHFTGKDFQTLDSMMKKEMDSLYKSDKTLAYDALRDIRKVWNQSAERSLEAKGGPDMLGKWKDVNERYAMNSLLYDVTDLHGNVDPSKIYRAISGKDKVRLLDGQGNRIRPIHQIAKYEELRAPTLEHGLATAHVGGEGKSSPTLMFLQNPISKNIPVIDQMLLKHYLGGKTSVGGLANAIPGISPMMGGSGPAGQLGNIGQYSRAGMMGTRPVDEMDEKTRWGIGKTYNIGSSAIDKLLYELGLSDGGY